MSKEGASFKVRDDLKFWILEQRTKEEGEKTKGAKEEEYKANAWVFEKERDAIIKLKELMTQEDVDPSNLQSIEKMGKKYNLQEVQIAREKYNMRAVSWLKVFLLSSAKK